MTDTLNLPELPEMPKRPECFDFAMEVAGDPEATEVRAYVEALERHAVAYATAAVLAEREKNARIADDARATRVESAAQNNGRASDFAFGYVNAAEEIASAIRGSSPASQGEGE